MAERVLVTGDRKWKCYKTIRLVLKTIIDTVGLECLIEGEANGADKLSAWAAQELGVPQDCILRFPAKWNEHGRAAGPIRNREMLEKGKPTVVVAFHENIAQSKGTADMIRIAEKAGVPTVLFDITAG